MSNVHHGVTQLAWAESQLSILVTSWGHVVDFTQACAAGFKPRIQQGRRFE